MSETQVALLRKYGLAVRGFKGQHLLVDPNIQRKIVELVDPQSGEWILEIGPGLGALTAELLAAGAFVIAIEKDKRFCEILEGELGQEYKDKLWIENADVLKADLGKLLRRAQSMAVGGARSPRTTRGRGNPAPTNKIQRKIKIVSNLPYYVTSPILFWLIDNRSFLEKAVLMMQKEVARRLLAQPGDKDYSRLTLGVRYYGEVHRAFDVSRNCFTPKPEVDSSVLTIDFHPVSKLPKGIEEDFLFHLIQVAFGARRKILLNRLSHDPEIEKSRDELLKVLKTLGIQENARGEELLLKDFINLAERLR